MQLQNPDLQPEFSQPAKQPGSVEPAAATGSPPKKSLKKLLMVAIAVVSALIVTMVVSFVVWYRVQMLPKTSNDIYHVITIQSGDSTTNIAEALEEKQIIRSSRAFVWHVRLNQVPGLQAGSYRLSSKLSSAEIAAILASGKVSTLDVLIPPGLRLKQITARLVEAGFEPVEIESALNAVRDHPLLKNVPRNVPLEGYLFPDTYKIGPDTTAEQLVRLMLTTFESKITPEIRTGVQNQGLTLEQAVVLASIVQMEEAEYDTQQKVAQVFIKRLNEGVPLGADPTFKYAAAETGQPAVPSLQSPYNTRLVSGLPPSPIANFNITALMAVANPADTSYNYFVAGDNGITYFSFTQEQHEAFTQKYCQSCFR
jgi:UPF0755 protein